MLPDFAPQPLASPYRLLAHALAPFVGLDFLWLCVLSRRQVEQALEAQAELDAGAREDLQATALADHTTQMLALTCAAGTSVALGS